jgi:PhnB protein
MMTTIAPWLSVLDADAAVAFYMTAFGAAELEQLQDDEGHIVVAQLAIDGAPFWVQHDIDSSPASVAGVSVRMIVTVDEPDPLFARAVAAGAIPLAPMHTEHGWRSGKVSDPFGHQWEFSKKLGE